MKGWRRPRRWIGGREKGGNQGRRGNHRKSIANLILYQYLSLSDLNLIVGCEKGSVAMLERYVGEGLRRYAVSIAKRSKFFFINWVSSFPTLLAFFFRFER